MLRRGHINGYPGGRSLRLLSGIADLLRWPFERAAWSVERGLVWPLRERVAGWSPPARGAGAAGLAAVAAVALLTGLLLIPGDDVPRERVAAPTRVAIASPEPQSQPQAEQPQEPALRGAPPSFDIGEGVGVSKSSGGDASATDPGAAGSEAEASEETSPSGESAATTSSAKPVPAGPAAMKVARRFSEAFVFYEIGERRARAKTVFGETATPELATALSERPPRQPQGAEVPKARVVNLVPGPRAGRAYTVSVSLLRVGLTSELRLELNRKNGSWFVTDVRG